MFYLAVVISCCLCITASHTFTSKRDNPVVLFVCAFFSSICTDFVSVRSLKTLIKQGKCTESLSLSCCGAIFCCYFRCCFFIFFYSEKSVSARAKLSIVGKVFNSTTIKRKHTIGKRYTTCKNSNNKNNNQAANGLGFQT